MESRLPYTASRAGQHLTSLHYVETSPHHADYYYLRRSVWGTINDRGARAADRVLARLITRTSQAIAWLAAGAFFVIGLIVTYEVVMRYVFTEPTRWVEETARLLQIYGVFLACAWLVARREHIRITVLTSRLPPVAHVWVARASLCVVAVIAAFAAASAADLMWSAITRGERTDSTLELPMWLLHAPVVIGLGLSALQAVATVLASFDDPTLIAEDRPQADL